MERSFTVLILTLTVCICPLFYYAWLEVSAGIVDLHLYLLMAGQGLGFHYRGLWVSASALFAVTHTYINGVLISSLESECWSVTFMRGGSVTRVVVLGSTASICVWVIYVMSLLWSQQTRNHRYCVFLSVTYLKPGKVLFTWYIKAAAICQPGGSWVFKFSFFEMFTLHKEG